MVSDRRDLWNRVNKGHYINWFIEGCSLSRIPDNEITRKVLDNISAFWYGEKDRRRVLKLELNSTTSPIFLRDLINSNLGRLGVITENKIGGKLNGTR